jgi:5,10-methylenetetrahydrofolate reductase
MSALLDSFSNSGPRIWVEVNPPRGIKVDSLLDRLAALRGNVDAINLTDNALAKVKLSGLVFAGMIKSQLGIPVVLNFSCRDRNLLALKSDLLGAAALGVDGVVAVTGDKIAPGDHGEARTVRDIDAFGLLRVMGELNRGDTGEGKRLLKTLPQLIAGAVANPNRKEFDRELELVSRKASAGAQFLITQPVFDTNLARRFATYATNCNIKVMLGVLPVKREAMANYLKEQVKDLRSASSHFDRYAGLEESQARNLSVRESLAIMSELSGAVAGFNIMSGGGPSLAIELALEFSRLRRQTPTDST